MFTYQSVSNFDESEAKQFFLQYSLDIPIDEVRIMTNNPLLLQKLVKGMAAWKNDNEDISARTNTSRIFKLQSKDQ